VELCRKMEGRRLTAMKRATLVSLRDDLDVLRRVRLTRSTRA
jgi:hypothetical protein